MNTTANNTSSVTLQDISLLEAAQNAIENEAQAYAEANREPMPRNYAHHMARQNAYNYADQYNVDPQDLRTMIELLER